MSYMFICYTSSFLSSDSVVFHVFLFFFNDTATTEIYTLSLHDALPDLPSPLRFGRRGFPRSHKSGRPLRSSPFPSRISTARSEEHTSELQSRLHLVCRLLLEKKKKKIILQTLYNTIAYTNHTISPRTST